MRHIAVRELAYFICQSGNLTSEFFSNRDMQAGIEAHRHHQRSYNSESQAEVFIKQELTINEEIYQLTGIIDGVLKERGETIIEEIKSTTHDLDEITTGYHLEHMAQLKIYGYLYALLNNMSFIHLRLTYVSIIDYEEKSFDMVLSQDELENFTFDILEKYTKWLALLDESAINKEKTIKEITFPFENKRPGQHNLMKATYHALLNNEILYAIAPTGIGKTMATLFSALKSLKKNDKLFYLTAKGSGKNAPIDAIKLLSKNGLKIKTVDITAKRKICNRQEKNCNPDECPFAIGFFDRLTAATFDIFEHNDIYSAEVITEYSNKYKLCAFEYQLYLSYFCDVVIADYNYVFDPNAHLVRYFEDDTYKPKVLVDEAHNLISRSKDMYSSEISEADIRKLRSKLNGYKPSIRADCNRVLEIFDSYRDELAEKATYCTNIPNTDLTTFLNQIKIKCDQIFDENKKIKDKDEALDAYLKILDFIRTSEYYGPTHRTIAKLIDDVVYVHYYCLDASDFILETIRESIYGIVFFSATLYPIKYHTNLLTKGEGKYLDLPSPFASNNLDIIINNSVSTKYKDRADSIDTIIETIEVLTKSKPGNYIIFFPSYAYMKMVIAQIGDDTDYEMVVQDNSLNDLKKQEIIDKFKNTTNTKVGFFVMGGVFSEGIDFIGDALSGVIIVGVGLPMVCDENNILKDYFEEIYHEGFDYAYTYPGFTKVIQSVGRVIRSESDRGVAILMDDRFTYNKYLSLMPPHWTNKKVITNSYLLKKELKDFNSK